VPVTAGERRGSLTVVGTGIQLGTQITAEARASIERADELLYLVADLPAMQWLESLNPKARSLHTHYEPGRDRKVTYAAMVEEILERVRSGAHVCAAFYGHPGMFVDPSHEAIRRARAEGFSARMLPAISAEACLLADLGVDPAHVGWQSYEATDFLLRKRRVDPSAALILWQIDVVGNLGYAPGPDTSRLGVLVEYLRGDYPADHEIVLYEASPYLGCAPVVERVRLCELTSVELSPMTTLYVPPADERPPDREMLERLGV
jgi:uncharacterized protein YabN with tetrapyrrole methylase and pyrophosphatase domain